MSRLLERILGDLFCRQWKKRKLTFKIWHTKKSLGKLFLRSCRQVQLIFNEQLVIRKITSLESSTFS